jgi:hypothetical protein
VKVLSTTAWASTTTKWTEPFLFYNNNDSLQKNIILVNSIHKIHWDLDPSSNPTCIPPITPQLSSNLPDVWTNTHSSHVPTKLNVDSCLTYVFIVDDLHVSLGGIDNITNCIWKPSQTYMILDLELECIQDTLKPTLPSRIVFNWEKILSNMIFFVIYKWKKLTVIGYLQGI